MGLSLRGIHVFFTNEIFSNEFFSNEIFSLNTFLHTNYFQTVLKSEQFSASNEMCIIIKGLKLSLKAALLSNIRVKWSF